MGLYQEKKIPSWMTVLLLAAAFAVFYLPMLGVVREFLHSESLFAVEAQEFTFSLPVVTAHKVIQNNFPLFPAFSAVLFRNSGMPMETVLRLISIGMLALTSLAVYLAAASVRSPRAGAVACAMYFSTVVVLEKTGEGYPTTTAAFFLLSAQLLFFHYSIRRTNWDRAWIAAACLLAFAFFAGGFPVLIFFIVPLFFLRRPMSIRTKLGKPGFVAAVVILAFAILGWLIPLIQGTKSMDFELIEWEALTVPNFFRNLGSVAGTYVFRLLPWSLIAWLPFCVALQQLDQTPIFSRYLRTLAFAELGVLALLPMLDIRDMIYHLGPLSILVGISYDLGVRRYGLGLRKLLRLVELFLLGIAGIIVLAYLLPEGLLGRFFSIANTLEFRESAVCRFGAFAAVCAVLGIAALLRFSRSWMPVWLNLLLLMTGAWMLFMAVLLPYQAQDATKRKFGRDVAAALKADGGRRIYKSGIIDLYGGLYYSGAEVVRIDNLDNLPEEDEVIYLISQEFPQRSDRSWTDLLPEDYLYRRHRISLWKGTLRKD